MMHRQRIRLTYEDFMLAIFFLGLLAGTIVANRMGDDVKSQAGYYAGFLSSDFHMSEEERRRLFSVVFRQRFFEAGIAFLISLTAYSLPCLYLFVLYGGVNFAVILSLFTYQKGVWGLPYYLLTLFPHILCYLPAWLLLARIAIKKEGKLRMMQVSVIAALIFMGIVLESMAAPVLLRWGSGG